MGRGALTAFDCLWDNVTVCVCCGQAARGAVVSLLGSQLKLQAPSAPAGDAPQASDEASEGPVPVGAAFIRVADGFARAFQVSNGTRFDGTPTFLQLNQPRTAVAVLEHRDAITVVFEERLPLGAASEDERDAAAVAMDAFALNDCIAGPIGTAVPCGAAAVSHEPR